MNEWKGTVDERKVEEGKLQGNRILMSSQLWRQLDDGNGVTATMTPARDDWGYNDDGNLARQEEGKENKQNKKEGRENEHARMKQKRSEKSSAGASAIKKTNFRKK